MTKIQVVKYFCELSEKFFGIAPLRNVIDRTDGKHAWFAFSDPPIQSRTPFILISELLRFVEHITSSIDPVAIIHIVT